MARNTTPTPERGYERPNIGDDWALVWDDLVEDLDANGVYTDANGLSIEDGSGTEALRLEFDDFLTIRDGNGDRVFKLDLNTGDLRLAGGLVLNDNSL
jgi:hypothetical protein